ncbi:MAG: phage tail tube protein [Patescibacteria group bacterium]
MAKFIGSRIDLGIGKETSRGTAVAPGYWLRPSEVSVDEHIMQSVDESSRNLIEDSVDAQLVGKYGEGNFTLPIRDKSFGLLMLALFGSVADSTVETGVYDHVYSVQQSNQHQSLSLHLKEANAGKDYVLAMLTDMEFAVELEKHAMGKFGFRSKTGATQSRSATYVAENIFLPTHGEIRFASSLAGLAGASAVKVRSVTLKVTKNVEEDRALGDANPQDILNRMFQVEGEITLVYDDQSQVTNLLANTVQSVRIDLTNAAVTLGAASNPRVRYELAKALLSEVSRSMGKGDVVLQTLKFKAFYSESDSAMITGTVRNTVASY